MVLSLEHYEEVVCDYNDGDGYWTVDAWRPDEDTGTVIAVIHETAGDVFYIEPEARFSPKAQEVIKEKVKEIKGE